MADINDTFDRLKSSVNRGVATISVKAESTIEKTKIKTHINTLETESNKLLADAGRKAYEIWRSGTSDYTQLASVFTKVLEKKSEMETLRKSLEELPEKENQILGRDENLRPTDEPQFRFCSVCGAKISAKAKFCIKCGAKLG